jgi:hypothetical protein
VQAPGTRGKVCVGGLLKAHRLNLTVQFPSARP